MSTNPPPPERIPANPERAAGSDVEGVGGLPGLTGRPGWLVGVCRPAGYAGVTPRID